MTDQELLEIILQKIGDMDSRMLVIESNIATKDGLIDAKAEMTSIRADVKFTKEAVIRIENDHGQKLGALFDGYKLNSEKLDRIESEVKKHEEFILKRIR